MICATMPPDEALVLGLVAHLEQLQEKNQEVPVAALIFRAADTAHATGTVAGIGFQNSSATRDATGEATASQSGGAAEAGMVARLEIVASADNQISNKNDPTAHAEMQAIRTAAHKLKRKRLPECSLLTTLEPCLMCTGAISLARLQAVYYLCRTQTGLGMSHFGDTQRDALNHFPEVVFLEEYEKRVQWLLRDFFGKRRR